MAPPQGKGNLLGQLERYSTPTEEPKKKQRDMSRSPAPTPKQKNPDLGAQVSRGPEAPPAPSPQITTPQPSGPPVAPLQRYGVNMDINQVNDNIKQIVDAHFGKMGYTPTAGLVFDVLKAHNVIADHTGAVNYQDLFGTPTSMRQAQTMSIARTGSGDEIASAPVMQPKIGDLVKAVNDAAKQDISYFDRTGHAVTRESNSSALSALLDKNNPEFSVALADPTKAPVLYTTLTRAYEKAGYVINSKNVFASGLAPQSYDKFLNIVGIPMIAMAQIIQATPSFAFGAVQLAKAATLDVIDAARLASPSGSIPRGEQPKIPMHLYHTGVDIKKGVVYDFTHAAQMPGYLLLDVWGGYSAIAAGIARTAAAGSALRAGEFGAAGKALIFKAPPAFTTMHFGTFAADMRLSDTIGVRVLQEHTPWVGRYARQRNLEAMYTHGYTDLDPPPLIERFMGGTMRSIARQKARDLQIEMAIAMTPKTELERFSRWSSLARAVVDDIRTGEAKGQWRSLAAKHKFGTEKAIQVIFTRDPTPIETWRSFHQREIQRLEDAKATHELSTFEAANVEADVPMEKIRKSDRAFRAAQGEIDRQIIAHKAHLEALDFAEKIIANPPARLKPFIDRAFEVAEQIEHVKTVALGLDPVIADQHIAALAATVRGENVIDIGNGLKGVSETPVDDLLAQIEKVTNRHKDASKRLSHSQAVNRLHPGTVNQELAANALAVGKHDKELTRLNARLKKIQQAATPLIGREIATEGADANVAALREGTPGSAHFTTQPEKYRPQPGKTLTGRMATRARYGLRPHKYLFKSWTGDSIEMGTFRFDTSQLLAEQMESAFHAATVYTKWKDLWDASVPGEVPPSSRHMPIRDIADAPEATKELVAKLESFKLDQTFANLVRGEILGDLTKHLYELPPVKNPHQRWVDENLIMDKMGAVDTQFWRVADHLMGKVMSPINDPMRFMLIFASPSYILNALGSAATLIRETGFLAPARLIRAFYSTHIYGPEVTRLFDRLGGETHTAALQSERGLIGKGSQALQNAWQAITDRFFRRAAVIHELMRHGLLKDHLSQEELYASLMDPSNEVRTKINMASQGSRDNMLNFNAISWPEKAILRHLIFVYSFVRASGLWSLRYLRDSGGQAAILAQTGKEREQQIIDYVGHMPEWFVRQGYFAVHPGLIYNPIQWNMPGMLSQIATPITAVYGNTPYSQLGELLGPAGTIGTELLTGHDLQGNALPKSSFGALGGAAIDQWNQTPLGALALKERKHQADVANPLKPEPVASSFQDPIGSALSRERSGISQNVFANDNWWQTVGIGLFRSAVPREVNRAAGEARYWRDLRKTDPAAYHAHEMQKVVEMVKRQAQVVGEPVPDGVIQAVETVARVSQAIEKYQADNPSKGTPNPKTLNQVTLDSLIQQGHIPKGDRPKWMAKIKEDIELKQINATRVDLLVAGGGLPWKQWVDKVAVIDKYATTHLDAVADTLKRNGLGTYDVSNAPREQRWEYGRRAQKMIDHAKEIAAQVPASAGDAAIRQQEWIQYINENDKPITIKGVTYPSPFLYEFATKEPDIQGKAMAMLAQRKPSTLAAYQVQLLTGQRPDPIISRAWKTIYDHVKEETAHLPFGKKLPSGSLKHWEDQMTQAVPEFKAALAADRVPLAIRLGTYKPIQNSPNAEAWSWLLRQASQIYTKGAAIYKTSTGNPKQDLILATWKSVLPQVKAVLHDSYPQFSSELRVYTGANDKNEDAKLTHFLESLVKP